ncbi:MAG: cupin domain-containing protein [Clostridia bacterium]|nr:cupin domain-containing protein [Clostridia bacterium]
MLPQVEQIAARVRELRTILEIDADTVAERIGVSREVYDDYENAVTDIPVGKLYLIAGELKVDPTVLLLGDEPRMVDYTIIRQGNGLDVERYKGYKFTSLAYNYIDREMEPMIVTLDPTDTMPELVTHDGQEFNLVLEGTIAVNLGDREYVLKAGDSMYFNPSIPHGQRAIGTVSKFLTVINENMKN